MSLQPLSSENDPLRNDDFFQNTDQHWKRIAANDSIGSIDSDLDSQISQNKAIQQGKFRIRWYRPGSHDFDSMFTGTIAAARRARMGVKSPSQMEMGAPLNSETDTSSQYPDPINLSPHLTDSELEEDSLEMTVRLVDHSDGGPDESSSSKHLGQPTFSLESLNDLTVQQPHPDRSHSLDSTLHSQEYGTEVNSGTSKVRVFGWRKNSDGNIGQVEMVPLVCQTSVQVPDEESLVGHEVTVMHRGEKWFKRGLVAGLAANAGLAIGSGIVAAITAKGTVLTIASILGIATGPVGWVIGSIALTVIVSSCVAGAAVGAPILIYDVKKAKRNREQFEEMQRECYLGEINAVSPPKRGLKEAIDFNLDEFYFESDDSLDLQDVSELGAAGSAIPEESEIEISSKDIASSSYTGTSREKTSDTSE